MTIVATAIPTISSELHSASGYLWIGGAYLLANAAGAPVWAKISDIWGRKPILLVAVAMFLGSSIMCALANSMEMLIVARALQGTAGGGLLGLVNIVISDIFSMRQAIDARIFERNPHTNYHLGSEAYFLAFASASGRLPAV